MEVYTSLIIDIKKSRVYSVAVRNEIQEYLLKCVDALNFILKEQMVFPVDFSAGDELQGLFRHTAAAFMYVRLLGIVMKPVEIRAGIGVGEWNVRVSDGGSTRQDGPAYHIARRAIEEVHGRQTERFRIMANDRPDIMGTYLANASMRLLEEQTWFQGQVQFISELMFPFVLSETQAEKMDESGGLLMEHFWQFRRNMPSAKSGTGIWTMPDRKAADGNIKVKGSVKVQKVIYINGELEDGEKRLEHQNAASIITEITGSTRQNVEKMIKRGSVMIVRNMDFMALQYLYREYGG